MLLESYYSERFYGWRMFHLGIFFMRFIIEDEIFFFEDWLLRNLILIFIYTETISYIYMLEL